MFLAWRLKIREARLALDDGRWDEAASLLQRESVRGFLPAKKLSRQLAERLSQRAEQLQRLSGQLHESLGQEAWTEVLATAEAMLELAPEHQLARRAKRKAWQAVRMDVTRATRPASERPNAPVALRYRGMGQSLLGSTKRSRSAANVETKSTNRQPCRRLVAWIDAVGGYMVCLGDEVVLGQPASSGVSADIPILADLSRRHAVLRRDGESYIITPIHSVSVDGAKLTGPAVLRDRALLELGDTVRLRFRKPHALSATAVLTLESQHKTEPAVDAVVLMADSCILGPQGHSHIQCRRWPSDLVLMRRDRQLLLRTDMPMKIDGEPSGPQSLLAGNSRLESDEIALSFEEI